MSVLAVTDLRVRRGRRDVLADLNLTISAGEVVGCIGPNGAGKTTMMHALLGLLPHTGRVTAPDAREIGFVPQEHGVATGARPREWVAHWAAVRGAAPAEVDAVLQRLGVPDVRRSVRQLSIGERRRVAVAAAIVGEPRLLILDEPTVGLDPESRARMLREVRRLADTGTAVLFSSHLIDDLTRTATRVFALRDGAIVGAGSVETLGALAADMFEVGDE